jgi:stress response protein YsnF
MTQTITALFDTVDAAEKAARDLAERVGGVRGTIYDSRTSSAVDSISIPGEDRLIVQENIRRGGAALHAQIPDAKFEAVCSVLEEDGAVDFDEREAAWRREGWTGGSGTAATGAAETTTDTARGDIGTTGAEERIPIAEERIVVGKREVGRGRVRIRSYVVETPVEERITLHQEHVGIERRPVDRPIEPGDEAFRERVIEATETFEEAVVSKEARVREEVVVRKEAEERTETVRDTVRRTEVEIEDDKGRTQPASTGTTKRDDKV